MASTSTKLQNKGRSPYKMLLLTALIIPCINSLVPGTLMLVTYYFGNFYAYTVGGTVLTVLYEIISSLFAVIKHCALVMTFMTLGSCLFKYGVFRTLKGAGLASLLSLGEIIASVLVLILTFLLGVNDSTLALPNQLLSLLPVAGLRVLFAVFFYLMALPVYLVAKAVAAHSAKNQQGADKKGASGSAFLLATLIAIGVYTCYLFIDPITVVLTPADGGNILNNYILPLVYPLIYGGFMALTALKFSDKLPLYYAYRFLYFKTKGTKKKEQKENP